MKEDINNDDVGEVDISGVTIRLLSATNRSIATRITDSAGNYCFFDLPEGSYSVTETNPTDLPFDVSDVDGDLFDSRILVDLSPGENSTRNNFIDERCRRINGTILEDVNNDNTGDTPITGVTVDLLASNGSTVRTFVTGSDGRFAFECVKPGSYIVRETTPPGYTDVSDSDGGAQNVINVDLNSGDQLGLIFIDERLCANKALIDFETTGNGTRLNGGEYVTNAWFATYGINVSAFSNLQGFTPGGAARIFNTAQPGRNKRTGDPHLGSPHR